jgi:glutamyl-tRNA synthetase
VSNVRVRFAPSPTGHLHIGGLRTALFNWLFARHNQGEFFLRIEDTDLERSLPVFTQSLKHSLSWAGVTTDQPIMVQSERFDIYKRITEQLIANGHAYKCYCPASADKVGRDYLRYDGRCRSIKDESSSEPYVVRFKFPLGRTHVSFYDVLRGTISFPADQFDDFIIVRSDGIPVYNFVVVVDDAELKITHIIRGEDHIPNTPKQVLIYEALGVALPQFVHVPLILGSSGQPLSKRDAATAVQDYQQKGYLPEALCNYLVRLGWSSGGEKELFSQQELIQLFSLEGLNKSAAIFDQQKLDWLNKHYIKQSSPAYILSRILIDVDSEFQNNLSSMPLDVLYAAIALYQDRATNLLQLKDHVLTFFQDPAYQHDGLLIVQSKKDLLLEFSLALDSLSLDNQTITAYIKDLVKKNGLSFAECAQAIRYALIGSFDGPSVSMMIEVFGKYTAIERLKKCIDKLKLQG